MICEEKRFVFPELLNVSIWMHLNSTSQFTIWVLLDCRNRMLHSIQILTGWVTKFHAFLLKSGLTTVFVIPSSKNYNVTSQWKEQRDESIALWKIVSAIVPRRGCLGQGGSDQNPLSGNIKRDGSLFSVSLPRPSLLSFRRRGDALKWDYWFHSCSRFWSCPFPSTTYELTTLF